MTRSVDALPSSQVYICYTIRLWFSQLLIRPMVFCLNDASLAMLCTAWIDLMLLCLGSLTLLLPYLQHTCEKKTEISKLPAKLLITLVDHW